MPHQIPTRSKAVMARIRTFIDIAIDSFVHDKLMEMQKKLKREAPDVSWVAE